MRIIILGAPGAGKGTQAVLLAKSKNIPHISTGDIMRGAVAAGTALGQQLKSFLDQGKLVPDELVVDIVQERLQQPDCQVGFLLDGFPRTLEQARVLMSVFSEWNLTDIRVVELEVADEVLLDRIEKRGLQGSGRSDDSPEVAKGRLREYWEKTAPVSRYFKELGLLLSVDGVGSVEEVHNRILELLS